MEYNIGDVVLDDWIITKFIGEGSYGKVVEIDRNEFGLNIKSALKIISIPQSASEVKMIESDGMDSKSVTSYFYGFVEEIIKEIAIMSALKGNSNIVGYEDHKVIPHEDGVGWDILIRMELLTPLPDYVSKNEITEQTVLKLGTDIGRALEYCEKNNIVHRDIKPENIFISANGDFKLGDFGIAKTVEKTTSGMSKKGTYTYMAPEIYEGKESSYSVDMYSLALVMYRLLNHNRMPFFPAYPNPVTYTDRENALYKRMQGDKIPKPCNGSKKLIQIIAKASEYNRGQRYRDISEMMNELKQIHGDDKIILNSDNVQEVKKQGEIHEDEEDATVGLFSNNYEKRKLDSKPVTREPEKSKADEMVVEPNVHANSKKKWVIAAIAGALVVIVIAVLIGVCLFLNQKVKVPDFTGMTVDRAQEMADNCSLKLDVKEQYSNKVEEGLVISQDEKEGTKVKKNSTIEIDVSKGKVVKVPDFTGKTKDEADKAAQEAGLRIKYREENSEEVEAGKVISQEQKAGEKVSVNSKVQVVISIGKAPENTMPNFVGMKEEDAAGKCNEIGINYTRSDEFSDSVEQGYVMQQSIEAGKEFERGSSIALVISSGKQETQPDNNAPAITDKKKGSMNAGTGNHQANNAQGSAAEQDYTAPVDNSAQSNPPDAGTPQASEPQPDTPQAEVPEKKESEQKREMSDSEAEKFMEDGLNE